MPRRSLRGPDGPARIVAADDEPHALTLVRRSLERDEEVEVSVCERGDEVIPLMRKVIPHVVLLDLMMPGMDGMEVLATIRGDDSLSKTPVLIVTAMADRDKLLKGLEAGADDYLFKPFSVAELRARVGNMVRGRRAMEEVEKHRSVLADQKVILEALVEERTDELQKLTLGLVAALEKANELNDSDTGQHIRRVCAYSETIASALGIERDLVLRIGRYASLHDVGKVGIRDAILKKPGKLTSEEYDEMKQHTLIGAELLAEANVDIVARSIALCHHEKWDGSGYPRGLQGEEIPVEARIVTVADVFDALCTKRCYKDPWPVEEAEAEIRRGDGSQFDPAVVEAFFSSRETISEIFKKYPS